MIEIQTNIFIDTSTYLSFYSVSNDDLEQLEKIVDLILSDRVRIIVTNQVKREWIRNRDNKLSEAISNIEKFNSKPPSIPRFMSEYDEISEMKRALYAASLARISAITRAKTEAVRATTNADKLIQRIFSTAGIETDIPDVLQAAKLRMEIGDPPGKPNSLGDRINWEHLLHSELTDGDLHIISRDGDYFSPLDNQFPKYSLLREWIDKKNGKLSVFSELKPFLTSKFPQFNFKKDHISSKSHQIDYQPRISQRSVDFWSLIKREAIENLETATNSPELEQAVIGIEKLLPQFGQGELLRICKFAAKTDLIHDYDGNEEISGFFESLILKIQHLLDKQEINALETALDIELHADEFGSEQDPLAPDYKQMDLDLLDKIAEEAMEENFPSKKELYEPSYSYSSKDDVPMT